MLNRPVLLLFAISPLIFSISFLSASPDQSDQDESNVYLEENYEDVWMGPGYYYDIWFDNESDYQRWRDKHRDYPSNHGYHNHDHSIHDSPNEERGPKDDRDREGGGRRRK